MAHCKTGPKKCNVIMNKCDDKCGSTSRYICKVKFTLYDWYDYKVVKPLQYTGTPFHIFGFWDDIAAGTSTSCNDK